MPRHYRTRRCPPGHSCIHGWSACWCWSGPAARRQRLKWASRRQSAPAVTSLHGVLGSTLCCLERSTQVKLRLIWIEYNLRVVSRHIFATSTGCAGNHTRRGESNFGNVVTVWEENDRVIGASSLRLVV